MYIVYGINIYMNIIEYELGKESSCLQPTVKNSHLLRNQYCLDRVFNYITVYTGTKLMSYSVTSYNTKIIC